MVTNNAYGPRLYAYLAEYWRDANTNQNAWCLKAGLQAPTVSRWEDGTEPRISAFRQVADALGVSVVDVLLAAGVINEDEASGQPAAEPPLPEIDDAIARDPNLSDVARRALAGMLEGIRDVEAGGPGTESPKRRARRK